LKPGSTAGASPDDVRKEVFSKALMEITTMRVATALTCITLSSAPAIAGQHVYLPCAPRGTETRTKFADGRVETERGAPKASLAIDVDLEHHFITGVILPLEQSSAVLFRGLATLSPGSKFRRSSYTSMTIDRLTGLASLSATWTMPSACSDEWKDNNDECKETSIEIVYQCEPASPKF
jgi:hypothetical protein